MQRRSALKSCLGRMLGRISDVEAIRNSVDLLNKMYSKFLSAIPNMNHFAWIRIFVILANAAGFATCQIEHFNSEFSKFVTFSS